MAEQFDIVIIGGGNAGFGVSAVAQDAGKSIAFIEELDFGGTCPNRGCTPKKVFVAAAHSLHEIEHAPIHGIEVGEAKLDWGKMVARKNDMIGFIPNAMKGVAEKRGTVFQGSAKFVGPNTIDVDGTLIEGKDIVIATGSTPRPLSFPGAEHLITSNEVLSETEQPGSVVFIGGGVISMEFGHVYARAGTEVTILEVMPQILPRLDADAVAAIVGETERIGVGIQTGIQIVSVAPSGEQFEVTYRKGDQEFVVTADRVINGAGRVANVAGLDLEAGEVAHTAGRIEVDEYLRSTSNPSVWVAGDALAHTAQLSPIATYEGRTVGHNIINGPTKTIDHTNTPSAVYTVPALATIGLTEAEAVEQGLDVAVTTNDMTGWFSGKSYAETVAWSKVIIDKASDQIVGAHMVGHHGEDIIHLFALAMRHGISASDLKDSPMAFPTFASDLKNLF